jgi:hypothetical protein
MYAGIQTSNFAKAFEMFHPVLRRLFGERIEDVDAGFYVHGRSADCSCALKTLPVVALSYFLL